MTLRLYWTWFVLELREVALRDVFYFTKSSVKMSDIASIAQEIGRGTEIIQTCDGQNLNVCGPSNELLHCIPIEPLGRDFSTFEIPQQDRISDLQPQAGFIISYHLASSDTLLALLKRILERFGGWVGSDDNTFETIYDAESVDCLVRQS